MLKKSLFILVVLSLTVVTVSQASGFNVIIKEFAKQALKAASSETGKSAVDYFKTLFNNSKKIALEKKNPQLKSGEIVGDIRSWTITPTGNLSKSDIDEIAKTLKSIDKNREQRISFKINNEYQMSVTQTGAINVNNIQGNVNINMNSSDLSAPVELKNNQNSKRQSEIADLKKQESLVEDKVEGIRKEIREAAKIMGESEQPCNEYMSGKNFYGASSNDCTKFNQSKHQLEVLRQEYTHNDGLLQHIRNEIQAHQIK